MTETKKIVAERCVHLVQLFVCLVVFSDEECFLKHFPTANSFYEFPFAITVFIMAKVSSVALKH